MENPILGKRPPGSKQATIEVVAAIDVRANGNIEI